MVLMLVAATSLTGCITFLTEITVRGDGSGTLVQTMTLNPEQMKASMEGIAKQMGATTSEVKETPNEPAPPPPQKKQEEGPFKENELKDKAADLGPGVTYVSAEKIDTKTAVGVRVTYAFKDIAQLAVNPKPEAAMGTAGAGASSQDSLRFRFSRVPNGNAVLTVILAGPGQTKKEEAAAAAAPPQPASPEEAAEQLKIVKQMFKGLHMGVAVNVEGKVIKTNGPYLEGSRVTLMDIDFDRLLSDEEGFKALNAKMDAAAGDDRKTREALKGIKGFRIVTDPEISIEFAPK